MVYNSLAIINDNEIYSSGQGSCPNEACAILQAKVTALHSENERLKGKLWALYMTRLAANSHGQSFSHPNTCLA